ncbi:MAG: adenylate/guanylate cyclase domain-containing protein, partial [Elusimicrobia bacterium]|nr:adenylate/guanylate cyclase domain-containing protein [Elusimicrobiota bacterium]
MSILGKSFPKRFCAAFCVLAAVAYIPLLVGIQSNGLFSSVENVWHDWTFSLREASVKTGDPRLILAAVDDETVNALGFPLPRKVYARALEKLKDYGVKTVVFDVLFLESREGDAELAAATRRHGGVVHLFIAEKPDGADKVRVQMAVKPLKAAARYMGSPSIGRHLDDDGHIRTFLLFNADFEDAVLRNGRPTTSLAAAALASFQGKTLDRMLKENPADQLPIPVLNFRKPVEWLKHEQGGSKDVYYSPYRTISLMDIVSGRLSKAQKEALRGSLVMVASISTGYFDHYPGPFNAHTPGAEFHLTAMDNVLNGDALQATSRLLVLLLVLLAAWLPYFFLRSMSPALGAAAVTATLAVMLGGSLHLIGRGTMIYPVAPGLTLIVSFLVLTVHKVLTEGAEKQMIKAKFGQFVSPEIVEELANDPEKAKLGAQKREMTVFFLDIAHFTTISEKMGPEALIAFLNKYLSALSVVILDRRGTIDKFIGDCIMAFWNAPIENKTHARDAVLSALHCQVAIGELNKNLDPGLPEVPAIRIGINTGQMNVGFTGTERKLAYTVIGDEVNLASRLEGANKFFGSSIIISASTYEGAKDAIEARYLGRARVVGKETPVPVYEPLAEKGGLSPAWAKALPVWESGVRGFYDKKYEDALARFTEFLALMPKDGPGELYRNISRDYAALPPDDW